MNRYAKTMRSIVISAILAVPFCAFAIRMTKPPMDMQQLTRAADEVVVGSVVHEQTDVVGQRLETKYTIQVSDAIKTRSGNMAPGQSFQLTLPGGSLTTPPLTQYVSGIPYMAKGEQVVLFLRQPAPATATRAVEPSREGSLRSSYSVVGWNQGRFSVLTDPVSGQRVVSRVNLEDFGLANTSKDMRKVLDAMQTQKFPLVRRQLLENQSSVAAHTKDPLEMTDADNANLTVEQRQRQAKVLQQQRQRQGIPVQTYDSFIDQVRQFANQ